MPELTVTLSPAALVTLEKTGDQAGLSPRRLAERILGQALVRERNGGAPGQSNRARAAERMRRQLELARHLEQRGSTELDRDEKRALAERFGVAERTIYRDLEIAIAGLAGKPVGPDR
jgi:hypothetical protein